MNRYHLGFSGTRHGMSQKQKEEFCSFIMKYPPAFFHHGLCVGADKEAHNLIRSVIPECCIVGHPPVDKSLMATDVKCDIHREPKAYLVRNHDIVDESSKFVATPNGALEIMQSGTWATIRYARKMWSKHKIETIAVITP